MVVLNEHNIVLSDLFFLGKKTILSDRKTTVLML